MIISSGFINQLISFFSLLFLFVPDLAVLWLYFGCTWVGPDWVRCLYGFCSAGTMIGLDHLGCIGSNRLGLWFLLDLLDSIDAYRMGRG